MRFFTPFEFDAVLSRHGHVLALCRSGGARTSAAFMLQAAPIALALA